MDISWSTIGLSVLLSVLATGLTFLAFWAWWMRTLTKHLLHIQRNLEATQASLAEHQARLETIRAAQHKMAAYIATPQETDPAPQAFEFPPGMSEEEKQMLLRYLKAEGFIP